MTIQVFGVDPRSKSKTQLPVRGPLPTYRAAPWRACAIASNRRRPATAAAARCA